MRVIHFPSPQPNAGNGALELVRDYFERVYHPGVGAALDTPLPDGDFFLAWLANEGFKVVPL